MPPSRRRSASPSPEDLAGLSETAPPLGNRLRKAPASDPVLGVSSAPAPAEPAAAELTRRPRTAASSEGKAKVGFYQDTEDTARARAAYSWTRNHEGHRSFSDFVAAALMAEVERLEGKYHAGEPWPPLAPGVIPTGKPLDS